MNKRPMISVCFIHFLVLCILSCHSRHQNDPIREPFDTTGYAHSREQIESVVELSEKIEQDSLAAKNGSF